MTGDGVGNRRRDERVVDLVHAEVVELGQHARQISTVAVHVAPPRRALNAVEREHLWDSHSRVLVHGLLGHLEVEARRDAVFHGADATAPERAGTAAGSYPSRAARRRGTTPWLRTR